MHASQNSHNKLGLTTQQQRFTWENNFEQSTLSKLYINIF